MMNPNIPNEVIEEDIMDYENEVSPSMIVDEEQRIIAKKKAIPTYC